MANSTREEIIASMSAAAERMGLDLEDLQEMIEEVIDDCQGKSDLLKQAAASGNATEVKAIAHDIKGSTANYGLSIASSMALTIEKGCDAPSMEVIEELGQYLTSLKDLNLGQ